ncbi:sister chromatid cohesion protein Dcc1 [Globomyces pollinis-pini]|nr:sister chromatid cohesion protein Dcc1 [Globomyces pollinis-pini]
MLSTGQYNILFNDIHALPSGNESDYMILEVDPEIVSLLESNHPLILRGSDTDEAVLCTLGETYAARHAETSNLFLLLEHVDQQVSKYSLSNAYSSSNKPQPSQSIAIVNSGSFFVEVTKTRPKFDSLANLLPIYRGSSSFKDSSITSPTICSTEYLLDNIQASKIQLLDHLNSIKAFELNGEWRIFNLEYLISILELILLSVMEHDMNLACISLREIQNSLTEHDIPEEVIVNCLKLHSTSVKPTENGANNVVDIQFHVSEDMISRTYGHTLLQSLDRANERISMKEFLTRWKNYVPDTISIDLELLKGYYLIEEDMINPMIVYFPKDILPSDSKEKFSKLFKIKPKWMKSDILPYISDLADNAKELDAITLKYSRVSTINNNTYYTSRLPQLF